MDILWIRENIKKGNYLFSLHGDIERQNDNLLVSEVVESVLNGVIIEKYPDTGRGESCLVAGYTKIGKPIHIVCGEMMDKVIIITVYIPSSPKFKNIYERDIDE